ncbi:MAG: M24 family metallopeptidase, partial [Erysipelotrichaceae bacterium]|nr:M24 family metallopeptidase [Erysipelotrichaceae bacterium]
EDQVDQIYYHSVSHSLGLDTHDVGLVEGATLKPGMVVTVEPGLYSEKESIGIRIEDDILVTENGSMNLSSSILKTVEEIETFMNLSK